MTTNLFFSIILPTYNRASMISRAIESVINQSFTNWELIIVDDGSTDNTKGIVDSFIKSDKRIKYFYQENSERSAARNNGISKAKGDWICFLDSDDLYHNNHLETFFNFISEHQFKKGLFFSGVSYGKYDESQQYYDNSGKNNLEFVLLNTIGVPRACCHKTILLENKFDNKIRIGEDKELWSRIVQNYSLFFHEKKTFIEIEHSNRSINILSKKEQLISYRIIKSNCIIRKSIKGFLLSNIYFTISKAYIQKNNKLKAIINLLISISVNLKNIQTKHKILLILSLLYIYKPIYKSYN